MQSLTTLKTRLAKAKTSLILEHPFVGAIALGMPHDFQEGVGTACTNGKRVLYDPNFVSDLTDDELKFLVAHECMHPMLEHNFRRQSRDPKKWNMACVSVDSPVLMADGTEKPAGEVRPGDYLWSPFGPSLVYERVSKGVKPVVRLDSDCGTSYVTYDHKFLRDGGWHATVRGERSYQDFYGVPRGARVCLGELQDNVDQGDVGSYGGAIPQRSPSLGDQGAYGRPVHQETPIRGCSGRHDRLADCVSGGDAGRGRDARGSSAGSRVAEPIHQALCGCDQHVDTFGGVAARARVPTHQADQHEWQTILDMHMVGVPTGGAAYSAAATSGYQTETGATSARAYLASAAAVEELATSGAYAAYCEAAGLAERTVVVARGEDTPREVVDFVTSRHVFVVGGLISHNCDYVINQLLVDEGIGKFIEGGCLNKALYDAGQGVSEQIYTLLPEGNDGDGGGIGGTGQDLEDGEGTTSDQAQQAAEWKVKVAQAAQAAKMMGKLSAGMARLVDTILNPTVDWRDVLQRFVVKHKSSERSFARPNRRFLSQGLYMPSRSGERMGPIAFLVDCSGSVDDTQLAQMAAEVRTVHEDLRPEKLHVVYFDAEVTHYDCFLPDDTVSISFHGGGGTDVRAAFDFLDAEGHADGLACTIVLTDGYTPYPEGCSTPVIWAMTTDMTAPFGEHCRVKV